jgi:hypothetical protein
MKKSILLLAMIFLVAVSSSAFAGYPGNHGMTLVMPDPDTSLTRGMGLAGTVYFSRNMFPALVNIGNIVQEDAISGSFDLPITMMQKDDYSVNKIDVTAKGTWVEPKIIGLFPVIKSRSTEKRGVLLAQLDFVSDKTEVKIEGKVADANGNVVKVNEKVTINQTAAVLRAGFAYGILKQWALGGGVRILGYHKPAYEDSPKGDDKTKISGDPGAGLMEFELGTLVTPIDDLNLGLFFTSGASDNPKVTYKKGDDKEKEKIYRVFPTTIGLGVAYVIKSAQNLQIVGDYEQRENTERDKIDLVQRRQSFKAGVNYPINNMWMIRGGLNKADESGDDALKLTGITGGATVAAMKELEIDMNLGYFFGKQKTDDEDADYSDVRIGAQASYRFK